MDEALGHLVGEGLPYRLWTDAYLAAFALAGGYRLVSFDRDFLRFRPYGLNLLLLEPPLGGSSP